jgi:putative membrane protein
MGTFLQRWLVTTMAVLIAAQIVPGIEYQNLSGLLTASLLLGIFNAVLRPIMLLLSLPVLIFSLGLFLFVINATLLYLVGSLVKSFEVRSFSAAFLGGIVISAVSMVVNLLAGPPRKKKDQPPPPPAAPPARGPTRSDPGSGPVIDV